MKPETLDAIERIWKVEMPYQMNPGHDEMKKQILGVIAHIRDLEARLAEAKKTAEREGVQMTTKTWCWILTCDWRSRPHVHEKNSKGMEVLRNVSTYAATQAEVFADEFARGWNGDGHLTPKEQELLEEEARWSFLRHLHAYTRMLP